MSVLVTQITHEGKDFKLKENGHYKNFQDSDDTGVKNLREIVSPYITPVCESHYDLSKNTLKNIYFEFNLDQLREDIPTCLDSLVNDTVTIDNIRKPQDFIDSYLNDAIINYNKLSPEIKILISQEGSVFSADREAYIYLMSKGLKTPPAVTNPLPSLTKQIYNDNISYFKAARIIYKLTQTEIFPVSRFINVNAYKDIYDYDEYVQQKINEAVSKVENEITNDLKSISAGGGGKKPIKGGSRKRINPGKIRSKKNRNQKSKKLNYAKNKINLKTKKI